MSRGQPLVSVRWVRVHHGIMARLCPPSAERFQPSRPDNLQLGLRTAGLHGSLEALPGNNAEHTDRASHGEVRGCCMRLRGPTAGKGCPPSDMKLADMELQRCVVQAWRIRLRSPYLPSRLVAVIEVWPQTSWANVEAPLMERPEQRL